MGGGGRQVGGFRTKSRTEEVLLLVIGVDLLVLVRDAFLLERNPRSLIERTELRSHQPSIRSVCHYIFRVPNLTRRRAPEAPGVSLQSSPPRSWRGGIYPRRASAYLARWIREVGTR